MGTHWPEGVLQSCETNRTDHDKHSSTITIQYRERKVRRSRACRMLQRYKVQRDPKQGPGKGRRRELPTKSARALHFQFIFFACCEQRPAPSSSHHIAAVVQCTTLHLGGAYDAPHRVSRRHLGFGRFLPRIEGPVLVAVERAQNNQNTKNKMWGQGAK